MSFGNYGVYCFYLIETLLRYIKYLMKFIDNTKKYML